MEIYERIKLLRKKHLKLTQDDFGERLGVSRDTISNIELNRLAKPEQKTSLLKLICKEFNVNEKWLLNGIEPMFVDADTITLDEFAKQNNATDLEINIMKAYLSLPENIRDKVVDFFKENLLNNPSIQNETEETKPQPTSQKPLEEMSLEELAVEREKAEAEYIKSISNSVKKTTSAVLNTTVDTQSLKNKDTNNKVSNQ
jgi:transcriptional regulator with XRE-family HTH domain